jgi:predicted ATPase/class 3 adenylate cyclase
MTVFFFSDIEGSTELWQKYPQAMGDVLARHDGILGEIITRHGGQIVKHTGDGIFAIFEAGDPLNGALQAQKALQYENWEPVNELRVRISLHVGQASKRGQDYFGLDINRTARLLGAAWGGQIVLTCELSRNVCPPPGAALIDLGVHMLKDLSEPQHIFQLTHPDLKIREFPALRTLSSHPHNLPSQPTPFVGRLGELKELLANLSQANCRLLTILGPGGIGKTRLAMQTAAEQIETFQHGVYFVSLAPLNTGEQIIPAIADALKFTFYQKENPKQQIINYLHEKNLLLVLDNYEHLTQHAQIVSEILTAAPRVKILVTSRERLNLREEYPYELGGLGVPEPGQEPDIETASSVRLFLQSAERIRPNFELSPQDRPCVARICRLVDGIPLGIELAAGWLRVLSCQEIANEIEINLDFLETNTRNMPERHRSLRAVFEYSWELLNSIEQETLAAFSIFQGAFSRTAAEALVAPGGKIAFLASVSSLVDKSLLKHNPNGKYELHTLLRQYALEQAGKNPELLQRFRMNHAVYYLGLVANLESDLQGKKQAEVLDIIMESLEDIRSAFFSATQFGLWQPLQEVIPGLHKFYTARERDDEFRTLLQEALAQLPNPAPHVLKLRIQAFYGAVLVSTGHLAEAKTILPGIFARVSDEKLGLEAATAAAALGTMALQAGEYHEAIEFTQQFLNHQTEMQYQPGISQALDKMGVIAWTMGDMNSAKEYFVKSLDLSREHGAPTAIAHGLDHIGLVYRDTGDAEKAREYFQEAVQILEQTGSKNHLIYGINHLAGIMGTSGQLKEAIALLEKNIVLAQDIGDPRALAYNLFDLSILLENAGEESRRISLLRESVSIFRNIHETFGEIVAQNLLSRLVYQQGETKEAWNYAAQSLEKALEIQNQRLIADTMLACAWLAIDAQNPSEAVEIIATITHGNQEQAWLIKEVSSQVEELRKHIPAEMLSQETQILTPTALLERCKQKSKTG